MGLHSTFHTSKLNGPSHNAFLVTQGSGCFYLQLSHDMISHSNILTNHETTPEIWFSLQLLQPRLLLLSLGSAPPSEVGVALLQGL